MTANNLGRPSKYNSDMLPRILEVMKDGASLIEVCSILKISYDTLHEWKNPNSNYFNQEFSDTIKEGLLFSAEWWEKKARLNLENPKFNSALWYMNMKNRFGWKDKQEISADKDSPPVLLVKMYKEEDDG